MLSVPAPAFAGSGFRVAWTGIGIYPRTGPSMASVPASGALPDGAVVSVVCELVGQAVSNGFQVTDIWDRLEDGSWLPNAFLDTGVDGRTPGVPSCDSAPAVTRDYNGAAAASWALDSVGGPYWFANDCTYFVSQALWSGGLRESAQWTANTADPDQLASHLPWLDPGPSKIAASADHLKNYLVGSGSAVIREVSWRDTTAGGAQLGDVIGYDWDVRGGRPGADGVLDHLAIVTSIDGQGYPFVTQHSPTQVNRAWSWSESAGAWIEVARPGARAYLLHIVR